MALWEAYEDEEAEDIPLVCPECGSDDLESLGEDEEHVHDLSTTCIAASIVTTEHPKKVTEEKSQRPGKCMDCGKIIEPGHVICRDCIPF